MDGMPRCQSSCKLTRGDVSPNQDFKKKLDFKRPKTSDGFYNNSNKKICYNDLFNNDGKTNEIRITSAISSIKKTKISEKISQAQLQDLNSKKDNMDDNMKFKSGIRDNCESKSQKLINIKSKISKSNNDGNTRSKSSQGINNNLKLETKNGCLNKELKGVNENIKDIE